jgi:hypothetical protein
MQRGHSLTEHGSRTLGCGTQNPNAIPVPQLGQLPRLPHVYVNCILILRCLLFSDWQAGAVVLHQ